MADILRWIALPDLHLPDEDKRAVNAVEQYMADHRWDGWLQLGDFQDFDYISRFSVDDIKLQAEKCIKQDFDYANDFLDRQQKIIRKRNKEARFVMLQGNHDWRPVKVAERYPYLQSIIDVEHNLRLKERGVKYVRFWEDKRPFKLGKAYFAHGLYTSQTHAKRMLDNYGVPIFYGHTHDFQAHSKVLYGKDRSVMSQSLGCLCKLNPGYIGASPTNWGHGFGVFHFRPNGFFNHYVVRIFDGQFVSPEGKLYSGPG
jgi:predicted phosphodiesterase